ncbi:B12-binding domain-containing radical SAM protein [Desulfuribacillus stibiiarsenatis]|uniref:B12-binding domain-containing radical SAM protein n=1 Tax=Desulfuribacillus stibiiarsenatis TaxID=1390249 RepID=A0A1E5L386_9FIRM|nr:radical SAM protein [Desulfuribacillus stibiiarsenatis]OEH84544.1 B12-binding domain-containing radical SAM protein [Desulfuribacillus stibiiarsenatis]
MRKSILLITPENKEINQFRKRQFNNFIQITMPYLAAFIDESQYKIVLIDEYNQKIPYRENFDLVAITVNTPNAMHCYEIAKRFRQKGSKVVFGGPHVTLLPEEAIHHCDYLIIGEAEHTWPKFLEEFYHDKLMHQQKVYKSDCVPSLENIPIPKRELGYRRYFTSGAVIASRGCPYHCSYCNLKQIYFDQYRTRPIDQVIVDVANIKGRYFVFWDDNFFGDIEYAKKLMIKLKKLNKKWAAQVTIDRCNDVELLRLAKEAGCVYFFVGLESFSSNSLNSVGKGINKVDTYQHMIELIHKHGISVQAGIIFGFDTDTKEVFKNTLDTCIQLGIDGVTVSVLTPLPKTPIYKKFKREGRLLTEDWSEYNGKTRVAFQPQNMTPQELFDGYMWFRKEFYSLSSITRRVMKSKTNVFHNLMMNLGYRISLRSSNKTL